MADTNDLARDLAALTGPARPVDASLLGQVHDGLLSVPADAFAADHADDEPAPRLAVRRRA